MNNVGGGGEVMPFACRHEQSGDVATNACSHVRTRQ
jgi:hypothetical protein